TVLRTIEDQIALQIKGLQEARLKRSDLVSNVVKKDILLMIEGIQGLIASTVRNRLTLPEIAVLQKRDRQ
ncbi:hypothetical protein A2U01_0074248, partial [Trifolium medium]|nr:hypothetical protein [Trifolium medium]